MEEKKISKKELAEETLKTITELEQTMQLENVVKDNKVEFKVKEEQFRVRKPSLIELQEINKFRRNEYTKFVQDDSYLFRKQWVEIYKKKGIDIDKMDVKIDTIQSEVKNILLRLAKTTNSKTLKELKSEILQKRDEQFAISMEKTDLLAYSVEDQLLVQVNSYTTYMVLERKVEDKWVKHFDKFEIFMESSDSELLNRAFYYINHLIYSTES